MKSLYASLFCIVVLLLNTAVVHAQLPTSNLKMHLSADAGITSSGDSVSVWADQSGNGNHAGQSALAQRPIYVDNSINGKPVLKFNGTNSYLILPTASELGIVNNDYQIFIVARSIVSSSGIYFLMASGTATEKYELHTNGVGGIRYIPEAGIYIDEGTPGDYTDGKAHIFQVEATSSYGLVRMNGDGTTQSNTNSQSSSAGYLVLGTRSGGGFWFDGDIAEVLVYNSILSEAGRDSVENYLNTKYALNQAAQAPTVQSSNISISEVSYSSMKVNLTPGNGEQRIVVAKSGSSVDALPMDSTTYTANSVFGSGSDLGSGNYVVYKGSGSEVTVSGLIENTSYYYKVFEFNGDPGCRCQVIR